MTAEEYFDWLIKFKTKKTTDDCYTPPAVYDVVVEYVHEHVINLDGLTVIRPFYPEGNYTDLSQYDENTIVIDNPPFSLLSKICKFYQDNDIKFFLFAPAMTIFQSMRKTEGLTAIIVNHTIVYGNGAKVPTNFITNLTPHIRAKTAPNLLEQLKYLEKLNKPELPKYTYPDNVMMVNNLQKLCKAGIEFEVATNESAWLYRLESQRPHKKILFGSGLIVSSRVAETLQIKESQAKKLPKKISFGIYPTMKNKLLKS